MDARKEALRLLLRAETDGVFVNLLLPERDEGEDARERALLTALLYGVTERLITLDYAAAVFSSRPASALSPHTRSLFRMGLYQLYFMDKIPRFAAVSSTVALAKNRGEAALLNACLRKAAETPLPLPSREKNAARYLSVAHSFPLPTVKLFLSLFGEAETEALLSAFNGAPSLTLRVNTARIARDEYLALLHNNAIEAEATPYSPFGVRLSQSIDPARLPLFSEGGFFVQDEASQVEAVALGARRGERILDACAAPGGKSFSAAIEVGNTGEVTASELHASKISLIESGASRLGLHNIKAVSRDASLPLAEAEREAYDRVIVDAPCSGLGVFAKKPDLRYLSLSRLDALCPIQKDILAASAEAVKNGGTLVYSTCTLSPKENEEQVAEFLSRRKDFVPVDFAAGTLHSENGILTLLPHKHGTDGFFIAKLQRKPL